jgi:tetratricopeptide (TPR) repeat protein
MSLPPDQVDASISQYERQLSIEPGNANARFNLALLYKMARRYAESLAAYEKAIETGIDHVEEVYSNMGVLYSELRQGDKAREMYEKSLQIDPKYIPALFNLAALFEETGERQPAVDLYRRILTIDPTYWDALSRLAYAQRARTADDETIGSLRTALRTAVDPIVREGLHYALGKSLDDAGQYGAAYAAYKAANDSARSRHQPYDRRAAEQAVSMMMELFTRDWITRAETSSDAEPIFICGMFRSGSTLTEQILAAHPLVEAGSELDILPWLLTRRLTPFPERLAGISGNELRPVADEYLSRVQELFPGAGNVTDKRPDNFLHLGLVRAMFPKARIIHTRRDLRDNCLSLYFQQFGAELSYATDLGDIAHYYRQQESLMTHWRRLLGDNIFTIDYDELVRDPEPVLRSLLRFLRLPWDDSCLEFEKARSLVKTASIWQVREALHTRSSGRWQNYEQFVDNADALLEQRKNDDPD